MKVKIPEKDITLEYIPGDISKQPDIDIIVNAANAQLESGGGVAGAIHSAAGSGLAEECIPLAPIKPGEAVITSAHKLPNLYIIHCLGPVYGINHPEEKLLASCYRSALNLAESSAVKSIAFPAISTGIFAYPFKEAITVATDIIINFSGYKHIKLVRMVLWKQSDYDILNNLIKKKLNLNQ